MNRLLKTAPLVLAIALRCGCEEAKTYSPTEGCSTRRLPAMSSATCLRARLPVVPDYGTKLLLHIPGHRTPSPPRLDIGGSTRARPRTYAFFSERNGPVTSREQLLR